MEALPAPPKRLAITTARHTYPWTRLYSQDFARIIYDSDTDTGTMLGHLLSSGCDWLYVLTIHADGHRETGRLTLQDDGWVKLTDTRDILNFRAVTP